MTAATARSPTFRGRMISTAQLNQALLCRIEREQCLRSPFERHVYSYDAAADLVTDEGVTQTFDAARALLVREGPAATAAPAPTGATTYSSSTDGDLTTMTPSLGRPSISATTRRMS